jgi:16S rRNA (guanine527-N7)-methyltransferase
MTKDRIAELLDPFLFTEQLSDWHLTAIARYLDLLVKWNAHINLTAVRDPEDMMKRHFGESLFAAMHLFPDQSKRATAIDIGSGAGFPGVPLKIWAHGLEVSLIESNQKRATFLREIARALNLTGLKVFSDRAENLSIQSELVTFRAVENFEQALLTARKLVSQAGRVAVLIGESQLEVARSRLRDLDWEQPLPVPESQNRILLVGHIEQQA